MSIRETIRDNIVQPSIHETKRYRTVARVIAANERENTCIIKYKGREGISHYEQNAPVMLDGITSGWFPKEKDIVIIEEENGRLIITGPLSINYASDARSKKKLKQDIYPDCGDIAGVII